MAASAGAANGFCRITWHLAPGTWHLGWRLVTKVARRTMPVLTEQANQPVTDHRVVIENDNLHGARSSYPRAVPLMLRHIVAGTVGGVAPVSIWTPVERSRFPA
jgi:hypothetical protein